MGVVILKLLSDGVRLKKELGKMEMLWSAWVTDGLFTLWLVFMDLLCAWGWAVSELCWQCQMGASAGVMEKCDKRVRFAVTVFMPLVFHCHFLSPLICGSAGYYPQPSGKKDIWYMLFLTHDDVKRTSYLVKGRKTVVTYATSHTQKQLIVLAHKCLGISECYCQLIGDKQEKELIW